MAKKKVYPSGRLVYLNILIPREVRQSIKSFAALEGKDMGEATIILLNEAISARNQNRESATK
jgi:hypothetical protein